MKRAETKPVDTFIPKLTYRSLCIPKANYFNQEASR